MDRCPVLGSDAQVAEIAALIRAFGYPRPKVNDIHPTMKPVALVARAIRNSSKTRDTALNPFAGSGTILMAAKASGRRAALAELDPRYCDVIVRRWQEATRRQAVLEDGRTSARWKVNVEPLSATRGKDNLAAFPALSPKAVGKRLALLRRRTKGHIPMRQIPCLFNSAGLSLLLLTVGAADNVRCLAAGGCSGVALDGVG